MLFLQRKTSSAGRLTLAALLLLTTAYTHAAAQQQKVRVAIVGSYHAGYLWSLDTNRGVLRALLELGYLDNEVQADRFTTRDEVESSRMVLRKLWMDTKRRSLDTQIAASVQRIMRELASFEPDAVLLGDDNATNFIGNQLIDTDIPVVFWGVNGNPMRYGLLDSLERPGHNVTGVYQAGYLREGLEFLQQLLPEVRRLGVLSDASPTARAKVKELVRLADDGSLRLEIVETVVTNSYEEWRTRALELSPRVDAFVMLNHNTLRDGKGRNIDQMEAGGWYLRHVRKPDVAHERQFVEEGILCAVDDSGFLQGYEAVRILHRILAKGEPAASISVRAPGPGAFVVNLERARSLGIEQRVNASTLVEERIDRALALASER